MTGYWGLGPYVRPREEQPVPRIPDASVYEALARDWPRTGGGVPGRHDIEWAELAGQSPWSGGPAGLPSGPPTPGGL